MPGMVIPDLYSVEVPSFKKTFVAARRAGTVVFKHYSGRAFSLFATVLPDQSFEDKP